MTKPRWPKKIQRWFECPKVESSEVGENGTSLLFGVRDGCRTIREYARTRAFFEIFAVPRSGKLHLGGMRRHEGEGSGTETMPAPVGETPALRLETLLARVVNCTAGVRALKLFW